MSVGGEIMYFVPFSIQKIASSVYYRIILCKQNEKYKLFAKRCKGILHPKTLKLSKN